MAEDALHSEFADLWPASLPRVEASLAEIEVGIESGAPGDERRDAAVAAAHKLVGTLGTFGLLGAAAHAREIENGLAERDARAADLRAHLDAVTRAVRAV